MALISLDLATDGGATLTSATHTFSHTCTGTSLFLLVHAFTNVNSDTVTGATYNGVTMTLIKKTINSTDRFMYVFYLINPTTGAHNVVISANTAANALGGNAISYKGARQTLQPDASSNISFTLGEGTLPVSLTTVRNNCWTALFTTASGTSAAASTNSTLRITNGTFGGEKIFDNNGPIIPPALYTMTTTGNGAPISFIMVSISPNAVESTLTIGQASYSLTFSSLVLTVTKKWNNLSKAATATFSNVSKHISSWTNKPKS